MRVLMFGWEFSPFKSGGLGTACQGMATALAKKGTEIFFVLPRAESDRPVHLPDGLTMFSASGTRVCTRSARLRREEDARYGMTASTRSSSPASGTRSKRSGAKSCIWNISTRRCAPI